MDVSELNALKKCYEKPLDGKDYRHYVGLPALVLMIFSFALTYFWWVALIFGVVGAIYGFKVVMPRSVKRSYNLSSLRERNRFLNNLTQILTDSSRTTVSGISQVQERVNGELKEDLGVLEAGIKGADKKRVKDAFKEIMDKYETDVVFNQYMEQVETAVCEGRKENIETLKQLNTYHNDIVKKTNQFLVSKETHLSGFKKLMGIILFFIGAITFSFSFELYFNAFARSLVGWIFSALYLSLLIIFMKSFFKLYFDDEIMSIGVYKPKKQEEKQNNKEGRPINPLFKRIQTILLATLSKESYELLTEMNNTDESIAKWQWNRMLRCFTLIIIGIVFYGLFQHLLFLLGITFLAVWLYVKGDGQVKTLYQNYKFKRQLEFAKFTRLLIPYLKLKHSKSNFYGVLNKIIPRLDGEEDQKLLMNLMLDMTNHPNSLEPFLKYAEQTSGTDNSVLFMTTLFDFKQGATDLDVIEKLDEMMGEELMKCVDEIVRFKVQKFVFFPTKLTMTNFILVLGFTASVLYHEMIMLSESGIFG